MSLTATPVSKCLDKKTLIFGFEMPDLLLTFILLAVLNLVFGKTHQKFLLVWLPPIVLGLTLKYGKKGKPENFLVHWIKYQISPGVYSAFKEPTENPFPPKIKKETIL
ncbi:MAG: hypothetical protein HOO06_14530 [Bdellovibrionaceae bacterium]|jgi:hypothetical protein|nr:hypothetical protein [Pseudobdellovibrionaceae bacterium]